MAENNPRSGQSYRDRGDIKRRRQNIVKYIIGNELREPGADHHHCDEDEAEHYFGAVIAPDLAKREFIMLFVHNVRY